MKFNKEQKYSVSTVKSVKLLQNIHMYNDVRHGQEGQNITCFESME